MRKSITSGSARTIASGWYACHSGNHGARQSAGQRKLENGPGFFTSPIPVRRPSPAGLLHARKSTTIPAAWQAADESKVLDLNGSPGIGRD